MDSNCVSLLRSWLLHIPEINWQSVVRTEAPTGRRFPQLHSWEDFSCSDLLLWLIRWRFVLGFKLKKRWCAILHILVWRLQATLKALYVVLTADWFVPTLLAEHKSSVQLIPSTWLTTSRLKYPPLLHLDVWRWSDAHHDLYHLWWDEVLYNKVWLLSVASTWGINVFNVTSKHLFFFDKFPFCDF